MNHSGILKNKLFLYLTEFFAGMSVMAVELGASRLLAPYFSSSQIVWTIVIGTIMIAMALACNPKIIIADEPTTALDVTIQAQILDLLRSLKDRINSSIMLITHDLGVIAEMADYVVVMYAGRVVEKGTVEEIFAHPSHPYTIGLMASKPVVGKKVDRLYSIPGKVPNPVNMPNYCYFKDRCEMALPCCDGEYPCEISLSPTHKVSCYRYYEENRKAGE